jgi:ABC-type transport system substrate-binding protein
MKLLSACSLLFLSQIRGQSPGNCKTNGTTLDFIVLEGDANKVSIEDDIRAHLKAVGFDVVTKLLNKEDYNTAFANGDYHLSFDETWGAPYDPHAYAKGWAAEGVDHAFSGFEAPASSDELFTMIDDVLKVEDHTKRADDWYAIHNYYHQQAVLLGLWGRRIPTVISTRLSGYVPGQQEFDYPVHKLIPLSGSSTVTISPGAQTGMFQSVGPMNPHAYRPNEFFANNWVYEGLVQ